MYGILDEIFFADDDDFKASARGIRVHLMSFEEGIEKRVPRVLVRFARRFSLRFSQVVQGFDDARRRRTGRKGMRGGTSRPPPQATPDWALRSTPDGAPDEGRSANQGRGRAGGLCGELITWGIAGETRAGRPPGPALAPALLLACN